MLIGDYYYYYYYYFDGGGGSYIICMEVLRIHLETAANNLYVNRETNGGSHAYEAKELTIQPWRISSM